MTLRNTARLFFGYVLTGGSAAVIDLGGFALLHAAELIVPAAAAVSFLVAALENYVLTSRFVYKQPLSAGRLGVFLLVAFGGFIVNVGVTTAAAYVFGAPPVLAKLIGIGVAFGLNFLLNTVVVFRPT